jgi:alginate production protein
MANTATVDAKSQCSNVCSSRPRSAIVGTLLFLLVQSAVFAADQPPRDVEILSDLRVGHWVEVRGRLTGETFVAERIELRSPARRIHLWGIAAPGINDNELVVLDRRIIPGSRVELPEGGLDAAIGQRVRVDGATGPGRTVEARRIRLREPGVERILGRIDRISGTGDGDYELSIADFRVVVPADVKQRFDGELATTRRTLPIALISSSTRAGDLDDAFGDGFQFGSALHLGVRTTVEYQSRENYELDLKDDTDSDPNDDRDDLDYDLRARLTWAPSTRVTAVLDTEYEYERRDVRNAGDFSDSDARVREAFVLFRDLPLGGDLIVGRQDFDDRREWLYDQDLDAIRYYHQTERLIWQASVSTTLSDGSLRDEDATNTILYVSNRFGRNHTAGYVIARDFSDGSGDRLTHIGLRSFNRFWDNFDSWLELSSLTGDRSARDVSAWGADVGVRWAADTPSRLTFTAGYAYGSGDDGSGDDSRFRQTGLQDNNGRLSGVTAVRYYGEVFDPELSNMQIATLGVGMRFFGRNSVELIAHQYRQSKAAARLTNTNFDRVPNGFDKDLGWEVDLVVGIRRFDNWDIELVVGTFDPGSAFDFGESASLGKLKVSYRF